MKSLEELLFELRNLYVIVRKAPVTADVHEAAKSYVDDLELALRTTLGKADDKEVSELDA